MNRDCSAVVGQWTGKPHLHILNSENSIAFVMNLLFIESIGDKDTTAGKC